MVLVYAQKAKAKQLTVPLLTSVITFVMAGIAFFLLVLGFFDKTNAANRPIFVFWWIIMILEAFVIIAVSCTWRSLSFKATHLVERMGLLTLIVIGEGAIGVTKTISKIMGMYGFDLTFHTQFHRLIALFHCPFTRTDC
jgi:low temperature requirement protein LtrA